MPPDRLYALTDADMHALRDLLARERAKERAGPLAPNAGRDAPPMLTPEVYVAMLPCLGWIPPRTGPMPGAAICCIFKILIATPRDDTPPVVPTYRALAPVLYPDGSQIRLTVYNPHTTPIPPSTVYVVIRRTKYGRWVVDHPIAPASSGGTTTTTGAPGPCTGTAIYRCIDGNWVYESDSCSAACDAVDVPNQACTGTGTTAMPCLRETRTYHDGSPCLCPIDGIEPYWPATTTPPP